MNLDCGSVVHCGSVQGRVEFATVSSVRLKLEASELCDIDVPLPSSSISPNRQATRTFRGHRFVGEIEFHTGCNGDYDVYATLFIDEKEDGNSFALSLFQQVAHALEIGTESFGLKIVHRADITIHINREPQRPTTPW